MTFSPFCCNSRAFWVTAMVADGFILFRASETGADMGLAFPAGFAGR
jgi:hypothetical protein